MANRKSVNHHKEVSAVVLLAVAILFGAAYYWPSAKTGWLGSVLFDLGHGLFGVAAYLLPPLLLFFAVEFLLGRNQRKANYRMTFVAGLILAVTAVLHLVTVDQLILQGRFVTGDGEASALKALAELWHSGIDASLAGEGLVLTGGLASGILAQSMLAIAGPVGALILTIALVMAFVVLIFNVSYTQTAQSTADVIKRTGTKMDQAIRQGLDQARVREDLDQIHPVRAKESYNIELSPRTSEETRRSLLQGWQDFWQRRTAARAADDSQSEGTAAGGFANTAGSEGAAFSGFSEDEAKVAQFVTEAKLPFTIQKDKNGFLTISPVEHEPVAQSVKIEQPLPGPQPKPAAGITQPASEGPISSTPEFIVPEAQKQAEPVLDRSHWTDRTNPEAPVIPQVHSPVKRQAAVGPDGQLQLVVPYEPPPLTLLREDHLKQAINNSHHSIQALGHKLEKTLESFGVTAKVINFTTGPTITRFELSPGPGVKVSKIVNLADDIALNLAAMGVRIEAPIPGKAAIGIEIPNKETMPVLLRSLIDSREFREAKSPLTAAIGRDIQGSPLLCDLTRMPHMLIAGATGSGKSVCINSILMSILFKASPDEVKMLMIDPKVVELNIYNGIPHLIHPVVTDPKKAAGTLQWAVNEMVRRYSLFAEKSVRDISSYNASVGFGLEGDEEEEEKLPLILLVIDELSDLMATTPTEVEDAIARLTAMARAAGIHLIIATQRPSVDVITGVIKANIPSRIAFAVASQVDSRTILDMAGAEKLLGKGDMLYYPQSAAKPIRGQGAFITDAEVERIIGHIKSLHQSSYDQKVADAISTAAVSNGRKEKDKDKDEGDSDELLPQALQICVETGYASVSLLQRRMTVGYPRAARLIDRMHELGYIGGFEGSKPRKVLITLNQLMEMQMKAQTDASVEDLI
ncbi:MAG: DNA translocase FtsK [Clostridia bacterium]|nr:DNA translocase FtsK [Clostridia bacterium]